MNKYKQLSSEELAEHLDSFLIDHWSVSSVAEFIRNEKSFERKYIYKDYDSAQSKSAIIGNVYHQSLMRVFEVYKASGELMTYDAALAIAYEFLDKVGANEYKIEKGKTIEQLKDYVLKAINTLITSLLAEFAVYANEIQEILFIEQSFKEFISINGIDIPLPLKARPDIVFINKEGDLCILDHKAKYSYTNQEDAVFKYSNQAIGYALAANEAIRKCKNILQKYPKVKNGVKKFYFYENKFTTNRDGSSQIKQIPLDVEASKQLFEQILFEGVHRVVEAVQNPDYIYTMNPQDYFSSGEDMMNFWVKTHVEGLEGFPNLEPHQIKILKRRKSAIRSAAISSIPKSVIKSFTGNKNFVSLTPEDMEQLTNPERIEHRLKTFSYPVKVDHLIEGYSCDAYLLQVGAGQKIGRIYNYRLDIANVLGVRDVRIPSELVEYQNQAYVCIEVNRKEQKPLLLEKTDSADGNKLPIGRDNFGQNYYWDLDRGATPHMMIAGASGSGKSVMIGTILDEAKRKGIKVTILDPKYEFTHLTKTYKVYNEPSAIEEFMAAKVQEMDQIFKKSGAKGAQKNKELIIFDEASDCLSRKEYGTLEQSTLLLAQKARSAGIHLLLAAQRFSVKVLTGDAKANFPIRLCLTVASGVDSKVMIGDEGAEKLNGQGDALLVSPEHGQPVRIQCFALPNNI